jgi:hypothetical protein
MSEFLLELASFIPTGVAKLRNRRAYANCAHCGKFKSRPSAVCGHCGDDPVPYNWSRMLYDRERDWPYT